MKTEFYVQYDLYDTTALDDAVESSTDNADFGNLELIKDNSPPPRYGTLEHNFFVLDGEAGEFPDQPDDLVFFSDTKSDSNGDFADPPILRIDFTENHTSVGITLHFSEDWPLQIEIRWYDLTGSLKTRKVFHPDNLVYFCENQVEEYGRIDIAFQKALPNRYIKLYYVEYGTTFTWGPDVVKTAKLVNDTDPISDKIKTDKLTFDFVDKNDDFNIGNTEGLHKTFQKKQRMFPYEMVGGEKKALGVFFLDENSTTKNISKISAIDYKGMLENTDFRDGKIYAGYPAGTLIDEIMSAAGIDDYTVDEETANTPLYGTLKIQSCQKALREVLFACGSVINSSRRIGVDIHKANKQITATIYRRRKFSTTLKTDHYVSDVNVKYKTWTLDANVSEITKGTYGAGRHTIQLTNPAANMTASAGSIVEQKPYYVVIDVPADTRGEIIISGQKYVGEELAVLSSIEHIKSGEVRSTKTFTGTLLDFEAAQRVADNILDYYQLQQIIQTKHLSADEKSGDWVEVENTVEGHGNFTACIESLTTDLAGGFISTAKYRGYYKLVSDYYYSGEIFAGEGVGII